MGDLLVGIAQLATLSISPVHAFEPKVSFLMLSSLFIGYTGIFHYIRHTHGDAYPAVAKFLGLFNPLLVFISLLFFVPIGGKEVSYILLVPYFSFRFIEGLFVALIGFSFAEIDWQQYKRPVPIFCALLVIFIVYDTPFYDNFLFDFLVKSYLVFAAAASSVIAHDIIRNIIFDDAEEVHFYFLYISSSIGISLSIATKASTDGFIESAIYYFSVPVGFIVGQLYLSTLRNND